MDEKKRKFTKKVILVDLWIAGLFIFVIICPIVFLFLFYDEIIFLIISIGSFGLWYLLEKIAKRKSKKVKISK